MELARAFIAVRADASQVAGDIRGAVPGVERALGPMITSIGGLRNAFMALAGVGAAIGAVFKAGQFEQTTIAFETMIGSANETRATLGRLTEFAAKTPFEMPEILQAARGLIQFGERGDELMSTLKMLGNAASGTSTPFGFLALVFNQVRGVGKLLTQDFRQLSTRGIISLADIAKYYGITTQAAQQMLSRGKISFEDFRKIMASMSGEGGRFANLMEKQSKSFLGLLSTLKDDLGITARQIGEVLIPTAKMFVSWGIKAAAAVREWVQGHKYFVEGVFKLAMAWVGYKMAILGVNTAMRAYLLLAGLTKVAQVAGAAGGAAGGVGMGMTALAGSGAATTVTKGAIAAASGAGIGGMTATGIGAVVVGLGVVVKLGYDLWKYKKMLADEEARGLDLTKENEKAHEKLVELSKQWAIEARIAADNAATTLANPQYTDVFGRMLEGKPLETIKDLEKQAFMARMQAEGWSEARLDAYYYSKELGLVGDALKHATERRYDLARAMADKSIRDAADELSKINAALAGVSKADIATAEWRKQNPDATREQVEQYRQIQMQTGIANAALSIRDLREEVARLEEGYTDIDAAVEKWAYDHEEATSDMVAAYRVLLNRQKELQDAKKKQEEEEKRKQEEAKSLTEKAKTPLEKYNETMKRIQELAGEKMITPGVQKAAALDALKTYRAAKESTAADMPSSLAPLEHSKRIQGILSKRGNEILMEKQLDAQVENGKKLDKIVTNTATNRPMVLS